MADKRKRSVGLTPESRESRLASLAMDLAEKMMVDGNAPASIVTHFLKLACTRNELELEKLRRENALLSAKEQAIKSDETKEELYGRALEAMKRYNRTSDDYG